MTADLTNPIFKDEAAAVAHMEADRWPNGVTCPLCGADTVHKMAGKTQAGMFVCYGCDGKFTVRTGTIFERSHIPLHKWLLATYLMASSKKGISAHQLHRMLGITYKSAWFMCHRIREAMPKAKGPLGGEGKTVEVDETYIGRKEGTTKRRGVAHKRTVVALVERGGPMVSFHLKGNMDRKTAGEVLFRNADLKSDLMTDEASFYKAPGDYFKSHSVVKHGEGEYARGKANTNTIEGAFSIFKRGMIGTYRGRAEGEMRRLLIASLILGAVSAFIAWASLISEFAVVHTAVSYLAGWYLFWSSLAVCTITAVVSAVTGLRVLARQNSN